MKKSKNIVIIILILIIAVLGGYIVYDKFIAKTEVVSKAGVEKVKKATHDKNKTTEKKQLISTEEALSVGNSLYEKAFNSSIMFEGYSNEGDIKYSEVTASQDLINDANSKNINVLNSNGTVYQITNYNEAIINVYSTNYIQNKIGDKIYSFNNNHYFIDVGKPYLGNYQNSVLNLSSITESNLFFTVTLTYDNGSTKTVEFSLIKENNSWKVDNYTFPYNV